MDSYDPGSIKLESQDGRERGAGDRVKLDLRSRRPELPEPERVRHDGNG